jgi:hypothetical protein
MSGALIVAEVRSLGGGVDRQALLTRAGAGVAAVVWGEIAETVGVEPL